MVGVPLFGMLPGGPELIVILLVVVLLFGANKVPKLARASGQAMGEFRRGREDIERELRESAAVGAASSAVGAEAASGVDPEEEVELDEVVDSEETIDSDADDPVADESVSETDGTETDRESAER